MGQDFGGPRCLPRPREGVALTGWLPGGRVCRRESECESFLPPGRSSCLLGRVDGEVGTAAAVPGTCQAPGRCEQLIHVQSALWRCSLRADKGKRWSSGESSFWRWSPKLGIQPWLCLSPARQSLRTFFTSPNNFIVCKMEENPSIITSRGV